MLTRLNSDKYINKPPAKKIKMSNFTPKSDNRNIRVLQFLEAYERESALWNPSLDSYKNKAARDEAYLRIIDNLKLPTLTINDVKLKVKSIRTTYKKELRLVKKHKEEGKPYSPKLFWFNRADAFLRNVSISRNTTRKCSSSENLPKVECKSFMIDYIETNDRPSNNEETSDNIVDAMEEDDLNINNSCEEYAFKTHDTDIDGQSQGNMEILDASAGENGQLAESSNICSNNHNDFEIKCSSDAKSPINVSRESHEPPHSTVNCISNNMEDEYDLFCRSVAMQLRSIRDNYSRCVAKLKIQQILFEAETGHYKNNPCITIPVCQNITNISNL